MVAIGLLMTVMYNVICVRALGQVSVGMVRFVLVQVWELAVVVELQQSKTRACRAHLPILDLPCRPVPSSRCSSARESIYYPFRRTCPSCTLGTCAPPACTGRYHTCSP